MTESTPFAGEYPTESEMTSYLASRGFGSYAGAEVTPMPPMGDGTPGPLAQKLTECKSASLLRFGSEVFDIGVADLLEKAGVVVDIPEGRAD